MNKKPIPVRTGGMRKFPIPITIIASARIVKMIAAIFFMVFNLWCIDIQDWGIFKWIKYYSPPS